MISYLPKLVHLDDTAVTREERAEAIKIYGRRKPAGNGNGTLERDRQSPSTLVSCCVCGSAFFYVLKVQE